MCNAYKITAAQAVVVDNEIFQEVKLTSKKTTCKLTGHMMI